MNLLLSTNLWNVSLIVLGAIIGVVAIVVIVVNAILLACYSKLNKLKVSNGLTGEQSARKLLDENGLQDVEVKKSSWIMAGMFGNRYSMRKKTIFLRGNIFAKTSLTAVAIACQKVGLAIQHKEKDKKFFIRAALEPYTMAAPAMFLPLVILGFLVDVLLSANGIVSIAVICLSFLFFIAAFLVTAFTMPVEKKACTQALDMIKESMGLTENEIAGASKLYSTYVTKYLLDFVIILLNIIYQLIRIFAKSSKK